MKKFVLIVPALALLIIGIGTVSGETLVPEWVKNTALWYGQGSISEKEFLDSITYLIQNKIVFLDSQEKDEVIDATITSDDVIVTKPRLNQCSVFYQSYKNLGQLQFVSKYNHVNFIKTCVELYKDPLWGYEGEDRIEKLNQRFHELSQKHNESKTRLSSDPSVQILSKTSIGKEKFDVKFNVCAGDKTLDKAKVLVKSDIEAIQVGSNKDISENSCRTYTTQLHAKHSANITITILEQVYEK